MAELMEEYKKMKVPELKQVLREKNMPVSGTKADLLERLARAYLKTDNENSAVDESISSIDEILNDDPVTTKKDDKPDPATQVKAVPLKPVQKTDLVSSNGDSESKGADKTAPVQKNIAKLSEEERLRLRASKFGAVSNDAQKQLRAQRFGLGSDSNIKDKSSAKLPTDELEKLKKRADRFGTTTLSKSDEEEKKRKRAERFGTAASTTTKRTLTVDSSDPDIEAKKKKRAERFGITT